MIPEDEARYDRQIKLPQIGADGQQKILDATVLIVGMGGLGSPAALYLAAAGVGRLIISDFDVVEESNLQRQIIHDSSRVGQLKTHSAATSIRQLNPECEVITIDHEMDEQELEKHVRDADIVLDCCDNFPTRFAINRMCVKNSTALVSGAAIRLEGQILCHIPGENGPCYQCLYSDVYQDAQTCEVEGVLGPVVGVIGTMQALDALLILSGNHHSLVGKLLLFDALSMQWQQITIPANSQCPVCSSSEG